MRVHEANRAWQAAGERERLSSIPLCFFYHSFFFKAERQVCSFCCWNVRAESVWKLLLLADTVGWPEASSGYQGDLSCHFHCASSYVCDHMALRLASWNHCMRHSFPLPVLAHTCFYFQTCCESLWLVLRSNDKAQVIICCTIGGKVCCEWLNSVGSLHIIGTSLARCQWGVHLCRQPVVSLVL